MTLIYSSVSLPTSVLADIHYAVFSKDGTELVARTNTNIQQLASKIFQVVVGVDSGVEGTIVWDDGTNFACDKFSSKGSGGGILNGRIAYDSLTPDKYLEIIQGEEKTLTLIIEADGRFDQASADVISIKFKDPSSNTVSKLNSTITRVTEELDIQVFRVTLSSDDTEELEAGLLRIEVSIDNQKAVVTHALKVIERL